MLSRKLFQPSQRLRTQQDFRHVFKQGHKFSSRHLALFAVDNERDHPRLGVVIAKKNVKRAVARNRYKRVIRDDFRHRQQRLEPLDCIVLVYKGATELTQHEFRQCLEKQWQRLAKYYKKSS